MSRGTYECECDSCQDFRRIPWTSTGRCGESLICDPFGKFNCCDYKTKRCVSPEGFVPKLFEDKDLGAEQDLSVYQCFTPQKYFHRARKLFEPIWESPPWEQDYMAFDNDYVPAVAWDARR